MRHESGDGIGSHNRVGVDADENFLAAQMLQTEVKRIRLARVGFGQDKDPAAGLFEGKGLARNLQCLVTGTVVNHDDLQVGIGRDQRGANSPCDDFLFVVRRNQNGDLGKIMRRVAGSSITPGPEPVVDGERADEEEAPGHQHVADEEDPRHGIERQWE